MRLTLELVHCAASKVGEGGRQREGGYFLLGVYGILYRVCYRTRGFSQRGFPSSCAPTLRSLNITWAAHQAYERSAEVDPSLTLSAGHGELLTHSLPVHRADPGLGRRGHTVVFHARVLR